MQQEISLPHPLAARQSLFLSTNGQPLTTSRAVAQRFGKLHKNVLKAIESLLAEMPDPEFSRLNFEPRDYVDVRGKTQPEYRLTHDGFALLVMGFTGSDALAWKVAFLQAFNAMEVDLADLQARYVAVLDTIRPKLRPVVQDFADGLTRSDTALWLDCSVASVSYQRSQARRLGLLAAHRAGGAA